MGSGSGDMVFGGGWDAANPKTQVTITVTLTEEQAMALAQLAKRCTDVTFANQAASTREARVMFEAVDGPLRDSLNAAGFDPR
ncbi:MAG: hypothetical protein WCP28_17900 [Actinomycetes bacterium]